MLNAAVRPRRVIPPTNGQYLRRLAHNPPRTPTTNPTHAPQNASLAKNARETLQNWLRFRHRVRRKSLRQPSRPRCHDHSLALSSATAATIPVAASW
jgi:hypothetical protein